MQWQPSTRKDLSSYKIKLFCQTVRQDLGNSYPLVAVVYSPLNHAAVVASLLWPVLAEYFSVLAVMSYWNSKYTKSEAYQYTLATIKKMRELTGKTDLDIHVVGDGMVIATVSAIGQFLLACKTGAATSASLYPNQQVTADQLSSLGRYPDFFPANARLRLAAYHELMRSGKLALPKGEDPSNSINRGQFYQLLVRQFYPSSVAQAAGMPVAVLDNEQDKSAALSATSTGAPVPVIGLSQDQSTNSGLTVIANNNLNTNSNVGLNDADFGALAILSKSGILAGLPNSSPEINQFLAAAIPSKEAIDTLAKVIEVRGQPNHKSISLAGKPKTSGTQQHRRADRFFVQPAYAESSAYSSSLLSYFDAAQIVLLASGGLK